MKVTTKRRLSVVVIGLGALGIGASAAFGSIAGDPERIAATEIHVKVASDGSARIDEMIDYDFGSASGKHGIFRDVPGLTESSDVEVSSDAPDQFVLLGDRIKIGDPTETIAGRHRYDISYTLPDIAPGGKVAFNGVGAGWDVPITKATIIIVGPYDWSGLRCDQGATGNVGGCVVRQVEPGRLEVTVRDLDAHEGVSIYADQAKPIVAASTMPAFAPLPADDSPGVATPFEVAAVCALVAGLVAAFLVRRAGTEWVGGVGAADAAFPSTLPPPPGAVRATPDPSLGAQRIDQTKLAEMATVEFAPPTGVSAPHGGVILDETVKPNHKVAWLIEAVSAGSVSFDETTGTQRLIRTDAPDRPLPPALAMAFGGRPVIELGKYDPTFAGGWTQLGVEMEAWRVGSGLWDPAGERRRKGAVVGGILAALAGVALTFFGAFSGAIALVAFGAIVAGGGLGAAFRSWELRVRTPMGSALWLRVESFRRFLHDSEVQHVDWAVQNGLLRQYTAWAVAVGEIDHWEKAVRGSTLANSVDPMGTRMVYFAPSLSHATSSASTAPSSSGGGGGGVGGGGGGGGGGSW